MVPIYDNDNYNSVNPKILSSQQTTKVTKTYQNPIKLDRNSIKLEKDGYDPKKFYLTFTYTSERTIYGNFYFNSAFEPKPQLGHS